MLQHGARNAAHVVSALIALSALSMAATPQPDVLPYGTVMMGVSSRSFVGGANCTLAVSVRFHPDCDAMDVNLFAQFSAIGANDTISLYRSCGEERFSIATNEFGSVMRLEAAHDPFACLTSLLLALPVPDSVLPINLTAVAHPYEPTKLVELVVFNGWTLRLYRRETFPEFLRRSVGGPLLQDVDSAVAYCSAPQDFNGWTLRVLFFGAYNVMMSVVALDEGGGGGPAAAAICSGDGVGAQSPLIFALDGGRLDVLAAAHQRSDTLNATVACVAGGTGSRGAFAFAVDTSVWVVTEGEATELSPGSCWDTPRFGKLADVSQLSGRRYRGQYGTLLELDFLILAVKDGGRVVSVNGKLAANGVVKDCTTEPPVMVSLLQREGAAAPATTFIADIYDATTCLGQAALLLSGSFWLRLEYINGADAFWVSATSGSFLATPV